MTIVRSFSPFQPKNGAEKVRPWIAMYKPKKSRKHFVCLLKEELSQCRKQQFNKLNILMTAKELIHLQYHEMPVRRFLFSHGILTYIVESEPM